MACRPALQGYVPARVFVPDRAGRICCDLARKRKHTIQPKLQLKRQSVTAGIYAISDIADQVCQAGLVMHPVFLLGLIPI